MNKLFSRTSVALACALSLAACGGDDGNLTLSGTITGVTKAGLTLTNNDGPELAITPGQTTFRFPELIGSDDKYNVQVKKLPEGMKCNALYNSGTSGAYDVNSVRFDCYNVPRELSGTVVNLLNDGLVLNNGKDQVEVPRGAVTFTFTKTAADKTVTGQVGDGEPFGITVFKQPAGQTCTVAAGTGIMGNNYDKAIVTCS